MILFENIKSRLSGKFIQCLACFIATIACFDDGFLNVWLSPVIPKLKADDSEIPITADEETWLTSMALISLSIASVFSIKAVRLIGNKNLILFSCVPVVLSLLTIIFATSVVELYISRFLAGICDAMCFVGVPAYIGEIAEPSIRGILSTIIMTSLNLGIVITYYFGYILPLKTYPLYCLPVPIIMFVVFLFMPQSPAYLISKGRIEEAKKQLEMIRNSDITKEFEEIKSNIESDVSVFENFLNLFRVKVNLKASLIILLTVFVWNCSGIIIMATYLHTIVLEAQINLPEIVPVVIYSFVQFLSGIACTFIVDRQGRKPLLYCSCVGTSLCLFALGTYFFFKNMDYNVESVSLLPLVALLLYVFFASIGLGNIPIVYTSELFAYNMQNYGGAILCISFGIFGLGANSLFQLMTNIWGMHIIFWTFAVATFFGVFVTYMWLPETKNKSITEIQAYLMAPKNKKEITKC